MGRRLLLGARLVSLVSLVRLLVLGLVVRVELVGGWDQVRRSGRRRHRWRCRRHCCRSGRRRRPSTPTAQQRLGQGQDSLVDVGGEPFLARGNCLLHSGGDALVDVFVSGGLDPGREALLAEQCLPQVGELGEHRVLGVLLLAVLALLRVLVGLVDFLGRDDVEQLGEPPVERVEPLGQKLGVVAGGAGEAGELRAQLIDAPTRVVVDVLVRRRRRRGDLRLDGRHGMLDAPEPLVQLTQRRHGALP